MKRRLCRQFGNLYTDRDHEIVREAVDNLPALEQTVVALRFWQGLSIPEIARTLDLSVAETRETLSAAFKALEEQCLCDSSFSLSRTESAA